MVGHTAFPASEGHRDSEDSWGTDLPLHSQTSKLN